MSVVIDREGRRRELKQGEILADGERLIIGGVAMMDGPPSAFHDGMGNPAGQRPGYVFGPRTSANERLDKAYAQYLDTTSNAWRGKPLQTMEENGSSRFSPRDEYITRLQKAWRGAR
jgi:hypothetical protein